MRNVLLLLIVLYLLPGASQAAMNLRIDSVDNSAGGPSLDGYRTYDFVITTDSDWLVSSLTVTPDVPGQIYQNLLTGNVPPLGALVPIYPDMAFDSFVTNNELVKLGLPTDPDVVSIAPAPNNVMNSDVIDITWYNVATDDIGELTLARITIADIANGTWSLAAYNVAGGSSTPALLVSRVPLVGGSFLIPEPATMLVMLGGGLALLAKRRRRK